MLSNYLVFLLPKLGYIVLDLIIKKHLTGISVIGLKIAVSILSYLCLLEQRQGIRRSQHAPDVWPAEVGHGAQGKDVLQRQEVQGAQPPGECLLTNRSLFF